MDFMDGSSAELTISALSCRYCRVFYRIILSMDCHFFRSEATLEERSLEAGVKTVRLQRSNEDKAMRIIFGNNMTWSEIQCYTPYPKGEYSVDTYLFLLTMVQKAHQFTRNFPYVTPSHHLSPCRS